MPPSTVPSVRPNPDLFLAAELNRSHAASLRLDSWRVVELRRRLAKVEWELAELEEARDYADAIVDAVHEGLVTLDAKLRIKAANGPFCDLFGVFRPRAIGQAFLELTRERWEASRLGDLLRQASRSGSGFTDIEMKASLPRLGERTLRLSARPLSRADRREVLLAIEDVSFRKTIEETEGRRRRDSLQRELMSNVSHELRTPIAAIRAFAESALAAPPKDERRRVRFLGSILRHADRLTGLVNNLLDLSAIDAGRREPRPRTVRLEEAVARFSAQLTPLLRAKELSYAVSVPRGLRVKADPAQLQRVLHNLCENAIRYNRARGILQVGAKPAGAFAELFVRDSGIGVPKGELRKVFEPFHRGAASRSQPGLGLGLSIAKSIVEANGGRIWGEPAKPGTVFRFTLPLVTGSASRRGRRGPSPLASTKRRPSRRR